MLKFKIVSVCYKHFIYVLDEKAFIFIPEVFPKDSCVIYCLIKKT